MDRKRSETERDRVGETSPKNEGVVSDTVRLRRKQRRGLEAERDLRASGVEGAVEPHLSDPRGIDPSVGRRDASERGVTPLVQSHDAIGGAILQEFCRSPTAVQREQTRSRSASIDEERSPPR